MLLLCISVFVVPGFSRAGKKVGAAVFVLLGLRHNVAGALQRPLGQRRTDKLVNKNGKKHDIADYLAVALKL